MSYRSELETKSTLHLHVYHFCIRKAAARSLFIIIKHIAFYLVETNSSLEASCDGLDGASFENIKFQNNCCAMHLSHVVMVSTVRKTSVCKMIKCIKALIVYHYLNIIFWSCFITDLSACKRFVKISKSFSLNLQYPCLPHYSFYVLC